MKTIKFRGRRLDNGQWITGDLLPKTQAPEHVGRERDRLDLGGTDVRHPARRRVGAGVDPFREHARNGDHSSGMQDIVANAKNRGIHSHNKNGIKEQKV